MAAAPVTAPVPAPGILPVGVAGLGAVLPERTVSNEELSHRLDTSDEWITTRTGIRQRHVAADEEATSDLALAAARVALTDAGLPAAALDTIIVATCTPDHLVPPTAPLVAAGLGVEAAAFDLGAACAGFLYALEVGGSLAAGGRTVLVVGAETLTRIVDPGDRATAVLFGDGAAAVVLRPTADARLGPFAGGSDGTNAALLEVPAGGSRRPWSSDPTAHTLRMQGREVYRHAVDRMVGSAVAVLDRAGLDVDAVDLFVGHQANARILTAVARRLGIPDQRCHLSIDRHANTSAASIPLALADARAQGRLHDGALVLLTAFGAGLTWAAALLRWGWP